jgi:Mitochondrial carrier protein
MQQGTFAQEVIAGTMGGVSGICCVYPLDTVKVRLQTNANYTGIRSVLKDMVSKEGVRTTAWSVSIINSASDLFLLHAQNRRSHTVQERLLYMSINASSIAPRTRC